MNLENFHEDILAVHKSASVEATEHFAFTSNVLHQTIVLVLSSNDIIFWKFPDCDGKNNDKPVFRLVPWLKTKEKKIQAIAFHPVTLDILENGVPLLIVTYDNSLYILPTEKILNGENLSQIDITEYSLSVTDFIPSAAAWWSCTSAYHRDIAIIGGTEGKLIFYSLSKDCFIISTDIVQKNSIYSLDIYSNQYANYSFLLITDDKFQHWKLLLEKQVCGVSVLWLPVPVNVYSTNKKELSSAQPQRSHFQAFRTLSAEKFNLFKQKLNESSNGFFKSSTEKNKISSSDKVKYNTEIGGPLLQSCECYGNSLLTLQKYQGKCILTGYLKSESILSLYLQENHETMVVTHKLALNPIVTDVLLTDTFIFVSHVVNSEHRISIFSTRLTKSEKIKDGEFNEKSVIQTVHFDENEIVLKLYRMKGKSLLNEDTEKAIMQLASVLRPDLRDPFVKKCSCLEEKWRNGCLAVTNKGLYQIFLRENPWLTAVKGFVHVGGVYVTTHSYIFELNLKVVLELTVNQLIIQENYKTAASLYFFADRQSIKGILKLASLGRVNELLEMSKTVLTDNLISQTDRLQVSNLAAMCYMEKLLREPENNESDVDNFIDFLNTNNSFDEDFILNVMKSSRLFKFMRLMATTRGLYINVVNLIIEILESQNLAYREFEDDEEFWSLMNEKVLITGMLIKLNCSPLEYVRLKINVLTEVVLQRFWEYYDPTVPVLKQPLMRLFQDAENSTLCENSAFMINWITNFLMVHIVLYPNDEFDLNLLRYVSMMENLGSLDPLFLDLSVTESEFYSAPPILSCGFSHVGNVRNSELFVWGQTSNGCLGNGPSLSHCAIPSPVNVFSQLKITVTHVSCGRRHTLALTTSGVYSWGCSKYGQLGIGHVNQSQYPRLIESFHSNVIIYISAGQYHSLAIDLNGRLWSWGWAVYGQLGHGTVDDEFYPRMVDALKTMTIVSVCGGQIHSVALTDSGKVWTFGSGSFGQLGTCAKIKKSKPVELFTITEQVTMIATGYFHNLALSVSNKLYTWGINPITLNAQEQAQKRKTRKQKKLESSNRCNSDNKDEPLIDTAETTQTTPPLLFDDAVEPYHIPLLVDTTKVDSPIQQISCGGFHSVLLTKSGNVYTWGRNMDGQLGVGNKSDVLIPTFVNVRAIRSDIITTPDSSRIDHINSGTIVQVSCGRDFTIAVTNEGRVFGWGCNNDGQLGVIPEDDNSGSRGAKEESHGNSLENKILSFIRSSKRVLRIPQALSDTVDYPEEIKSLSRCRFVSINRPSFTRQLLQRRLPFNVSRDNQVNHHVIRSFSALMKNSSYSKTRLLHYALECFSGYYDINLVKNTCIKHQNYQAAAKICHLNFKFFEAFHYSMKALLSPLSHFNEQVHLTSSEFISDASCLLKCYLQLNVMLNENKTVVYFLHQALSLWIDVKMPMNVIENVMFEYLEQITYPLSVLLFCGDSPSFLTAFSKSDIDSTAASSPCAESDNGSCDSSIMKNWFEYTNDESSQDDSCRSPTSNDAAETNSSNEFRLHSPEFILEHFSADFRMKLCSSVTHFISTTKIEEYREFIGLLNDAVFAPSVLKNDNRNANEVLSFVLHVLHQQQNLPKDASLSAVNPYIHVPFNVLKGRNVNQHSVLAVFSCGHNYVSEDELALEVTELMSSLDRLRLFSLKLVIGELFGTRTDINFYPSCCPKCLLLFVVFLSKNAQNEY